MFERFTDRARQVVVLAQQEARELGHDHIGTEHVLVGLMLERDGVAAGVLASLGVSVDSVRDSVLRVVGRGEGGRAGQIPFTPRAKKVLELALREALSLGHNYIGTEHVLLGLVREEDGVGARILADAGVDAEEVREAVLRATGSVRPRGRQVHPVGTRQARVARTLPPVHEDAGAMFATIERSIRALLHREPRAGQRGPAGDPRVAARRRRGAGVR